MAVQTACWWHRARKAESTATRDECCSSCWECELNGRPRAQQHGERVPSRVAATTARYWCGREGRQGHVPNLNAVDSASTGARERVGANRIASVTVTSTTKRQHRNSTDHMTLERRIAGIRSTDMKRRGRDVGDNGRWRLRWFRGGEEWRSASTSGQDRSQRGGEGSRGAGARRTELRPECRSRNVNGDWGGAGRSSRATASPCES